MASDSQPSTIDITPSVSVYGTYRRLSYSPWYAIAEFVDNSTQNYYDHRTELLKAFERDRNHKWLRVEVSYDAEHNTLTISDNAHGMEIDELTRAVVLDRPPPDTSGRCEYGMGLKTASCWFGETWTIRTSRLESENEYTVSVHVPDLVAGRTSALEVQRDSASPQSHFTEIVIEGLYKPLRGRTLGRVKDQLGSVYRADLRSGEVEISWNGVPISFATPTILKETLDNGLKRTWRKEFSFDVPDETREKTLRAAGWVALRTPGSQRDAGFALLRRGRVIIGGPGAGYKPVEIFGQGNTFPSQRLIGEVSMDEWPVTQAKDSFDWHGGLEDDFIGGLKRICQDYVDKANGYRESDTREGVSEPIMDIVSGPLITVFGDSRFGLAVDQELKLPDPLPPDEVREADIAKLRGASKGPIIYRVNLGGSVWVFRLHWQDSLSDAHWMEMRAAQEDDVDVFLNTAHPFFSRYVNGRESLELLQKFVLSLALAERMARQTSSSGLISPSDFRIYMNKILRRAGEIEAEYGQ